MFLPSLPSQEAQDVVAPGQKFSLNRSVIVTDENQPLYVQHGIREMVEYLKEITGTEIPVMPSLDAKAEILIAVGEKVARQLAPDILDERGKELGEEGFLIRVSVTGGKTVLIVTGAAPQGTKFALAHLMRMIRVEGKSAYLTGPVDLVSKPGFAVRGMHLNGWPLNYPYTFRCWKEDEWKRYIDILACQGVNLFYFWPFMEIMPAPLSTEDESYLLEVRRVVDYAQKQRGMEVWLMQSANRVALNDCGVRDPRLRPYWVSGTQVDMNPGVPEQFSAIMKSREALYRVVNNADGYCTIDSDPGGWPNSPLADLMKIFQASRTLLDRCNINGSQAKLINWMWSGWGHKGWWMPDWNESKRQEFMRETIRTMKKELPEPWWLIAGIKEYLPPCRDEDVLAKTVFLPYNIIEEEPSFPLIQNNFPRVRGSLDLLVNYPQVKGIMGNAQTPLLQFPHVYYFLASAWDYDYRRKDSKEVLREVAGHLYPEQEELIADCFAALAESNGGKAGDLANRLEILVEQDRLGRPGIFSRKVFPDPRQVGRDLVFQLRSRSAFETLYRTVTPATGKKRCAELVEACLDAILDWDHQLGWTAHWIKKGAAWAYNIMPNDLQYLRTLANLKKALGGAAVDGSVVDAFLAPIGERLARKYQQDAVTKCCLEPIRKALLETA